MLKKTLKVLSFLAVLGLSANANDLLADISKGVISDSSLGVKVLNTEEMSKIRGGYYIHAQIIADSYADIYAIPNVEHELGLVFNNNGSLNKRASELHSRGICPLGITYCYSNETTQEHSIANERRFIEYANALGGFKMKDYILKYRITNHKMSTYNYFTYDVLAYNPSNGDEHIVTSPTTLHNPIIEEIRSRVQRTAESYLGGLYTK